MDLDEPQKPKLTTDGEQTACHSYLTRSKVKRTSHSDNDTSGSQSDEPHRKRQTQLRAKAAEKSAKIKKNDSTPDCDPIIDANTADEFTPAEIALRNDLVLESLFKYMNRSDLLSCRIVNKKWQDEATKELRRRKLVIRFYFKRDDGNPRSAYTGYWDFCRLLRECRTPSLLSSFQVKIRHGIDLGSTGPTSIFNTVGNNLKYLILHLNYLDEWSCLGISPLMTHLEKLLFRQAPNLEFLEIRFHFSYSLIDEVKALDLSDHPQDNSNQFGLLPNLKTFIVSGTPPTKFFADVINAAVNLRSVGGSWSTSSYMTYYVTELEDDPNLTNLVGFSSTCIKYFMGADGRDKIHLLKRLRVYLSDNNYYGEDELDIKLMETFLTEHKQNLQLETFECVSKFYDENASSAPRILSVINKILECSSGSLLKLRIEPAKWFEDLLIIPRLPKLQEICIDCCMSSCLELGNGGFFPRGFNMNHSFPNVSSIVFLRCSARLFRLFVSRMEIEMTEPVPSVRYITLIDIDKRWKGKKEPTLPTVPDLCHVFPNLVSISCVDKEKYYKI